MVKSVIDQLLSSIRDNYINIELIRMGGNGDGGYLIPNLMNEIDHCFSAGVSDIAHFEKELLEKYDINCF